MIPTSAAAPPPSYPLRWRLAALAALWTVLGVLFRSSLLALAHLALHNELYSYIPLVPAVSLYLAWLQRGRLSEMPPPTARWVTGSALAAVLFGASGLAVARGIFPGGASGLTATIGLLWAAAAMTTLAGFGRTSARLLAFPLGFLLFCVPLPGWLFAAGQSFLQGASAWVAAGLFSAAFTPFLRQGFYFAFSDITIEVAPECSGFHSTFILLITSCIGAHLFLRSRWRQAALIIAILPLALLRNGVRIFVIGELCVQVGPQMIDAYIHRHGGPIFFVASLIPFFWFLRLLRRSEVERDLRARLA